MILLLAHLLAQSQPGYANGLLLWQTFEVRGWVVYAKRAGTDTQIFHSSPFSIFRIQVASKLANATGLSH